VPFGTITLAVETVELSEVVEPDDALEETVVVVLEGAAVVSELVPVRFSNPTPTATTTTRTTATAMKRADRAGHTGFFACNSNRNQAFMIFSASLENTRKS